MKKIFYTILITLTFFLGLNNVSAETNRMYMSYDGGLLEIGNTRSISNTPKTITNQITFTDLSADSDHYSTLYVRYAFCSSSDLFTSNTSNVVNTNIKCSNNGSIGTLSFFTFSYNETNTDEFTYNPNTDFTTLVYKTSFNIYSIFNDTFTLYGVDVGRTLSDFPSYDTNSDVLDKLDSLNELVIANLHNIQNTNERILLYVLSIYQNMVTCRDSYNIFDAIIDSYTFPANSNNYVTPGGFGRIFLKANTKYYLSYDVVEAASTSTRNTAFIHSVDQKNNIYEKIQLNNNSITGRKFWAFTVPESKEYIIDYWSSMPSSQVIISNVMISTSNFSVYEPFGEQICKSKVDQTNEAINETNNKLQQQQDFMNDDDTSGSSSEAESFFEGFSTDTYGLTSIITAPLELIGNIAGSTCSPLPLQIPFVGGTFNLPCMSTIYKKHFGSFLTVYQTITFGIVAYWVCIRIFALVKDFINPEHDEIEVMDL